MGLALSTSWNSWNHKSFKKTLFEIKEAGFGSIELGFNLTRSMVNAAQRLSRQGLVKIVSVHNYCPIPDGLSRKEALPDCFSMASCDETQRRLAVKYTKKTIDTASRLSVKAVVLHCGRVEIPDYTRKLIALSFRLPEAKKELSRLRDCVIAQRATHSKTYLLNTLRSLDEIVPYAQKQNICLGIETRFYYREIPSFEEIGIILNEFRGSKAFYWHDTGHARITENLELTRGKRFLETYHKRLLGIHLHDVRDGRDHLAPTFGDVDFSYIKKYLNRGMILVIEAHSPATMRELIISKQRLEKLF